MFARICKPFWMEFTGVTTNAWHFPPAENLFPRDVFSPSGGFPVSRLQSGLFLRHTGGIAVLEWNDSQLRKVYVLCDTIQTTHVSRRSRRDDWPLSGHLPAIAGHDQLCNGHWGLRVPITIFCKSSAPGFAGTPLVWTQALESRCLQ